MSLFAPAITATAECAAQPLGYAVALEEPDQVLAERSERVGPGLALAYVTIGASQLGAQGDPLADRPLRRQLAVDRGPVGGHAGATPWPSNGHRRP